MHNCTANPVRAGSRRNTSRAWPWPRLVAACLAFCLPLLLGAQPFIGLRALLVVDLMSNMPASGPSSSEEDDTSEDSAPQNSAPQQALQRGRASRGDLLAPLGAMLPRCTCRVNVHGNGPGKLYEPRRAERLYHNGLGGPLRC